MSSGIKRYRRRPAPTATENANVPQIVMTCAPSSICRDQEKASQHRAPASRPASHTMPGTFPPGRSRPTKPTSGRSRQYYCRPQNWRGQPHFLSSWRRARQSRNPVSPPGVCPATTLDETQQGADGQAECFLRECTPLCWAGNSSPGTAGRLPYSSRFCATTASGVMPYSLPQELRTKVAIAAISRSLR